MNHDIKLLFSSKGITHYKVNISVVAVRWLCRAILCCCPPRCHRAACLTATVLPAVLPTLPLLCCLPHCHCAAHCAARRAAHLTAAVLPALPLLRCPPCHRCTATTLPTSLPRCCLPHCRHTATALPALPLWCCSSCHCWVVAPCHAVLLLPMSLQHCLPYL